MLAIDEHVVTMNIEERRVAVEPIEILEDVPLDEGNFKKFTRIGISMKEKTEQALAQFLRKSIGFFFFCMEPWTHARIDPSVIIHHLNVYPSSKPVCQKKRVFAPKRDNAIKE